MALRAPKLRLASRYDARFYAVGLTLLAAALAGKLLGADGFHAYPTIEIGFGPATVALSVLIVFSGLAPRVRTGLPSRRRNG